jgi:hypothetical protein
MFEATGHVTLDFNNTVSTAAVLLNIEKASVTIWHLGLLYNLSKVKLSISLIKFIASFLSQRKIRISVEGEMYTPRDTQAGVPQDSVLSPTLYSLCINNTPQTPGVYLGLFADDMYIDATDYKENYVLRKLPQCRKAFETWCERWNIKSNEDSNHLFFS